MKEATFMKRSEKRVHLVRVAAGLFNKFGYHGAGIDKVIAEAGIAKTTLYRHFETKEELIIAVLKHVDEKFRTAMRAFVDEKAPGDPRQKLLATFDFLEAWYSEKSFYGCPFVSAAGEYGEHGSPVFQAAAMHKRLVLAYFEELARAADLEEPARLAEEINLLHEGATAVAHICGTSEAAPKAKAVAARLLPETGSNLDS